ncbi:Nif11-like leader peptide family natural product precursor [Calothrix sp. PCC 6303]|uniref:Nif11-like leader peptide family natural product precursor n=1 Tax=Calothrix sp. PCC 6303 TaxID=1170562 RepID=UPI0002A01124|nr:Nif11-like leader peptide family natural product precursor [Calothrix sp. PCC 6303]AFZ01393.1 bacteriocin propeptide, TIGR03798 family [Calothrix sp. PCC 6303]
MAVQEVTRLFRAAQVNPDLRENLNQAPDEEAFVKMAKEQGYEFTVEEWRKVTGFAVEELKCELSEIPGI